MSIFTKAKCPVDTETKTWVEERFQWLLNEYGMEHLWDVTVILPTPKFFPDHYDGSEKSLRQYFDNVCEYMGLKPYRFDLRLYHEGRHTDIVPGIQVVTEGMGTAGLYHEEEKEIISLETSNLADPISVIATFAHELGHAHLLGDERLSADVDDHEQLTDLITVFLGMGIFCANSVIQEKQWTDGNWSGWSVGGQGYLDEATYAWAHAIFAWLRHETNPRWMRYLRPNVRALARQGLKYLRATEDAAVKPIKR